MLKQPGTGSSQIDRVLGLGGKGLVTVCVWRKAASILYAKAKGYSYGKCSFLFKFYLFYDSNIFTTHYITYYQ